MKSNSSEILQLLSGAIEEVASNGSPSVVRVGFEGRSGTGVVFDNEGHILTATHVVHRLDEVEDGTSDGSKFNAKVIGRNPYSDLALLKVDAANLKPVELGSSADLKVGQFVLALANPFSTNVSATSGIITGVNRSISGWWRFSIESAIVTDARLNPGYSGGPLLDAQGKMIGMNVAYFSNRGIAVPVDSIRKAVERMARGESVKKAYLGIVSNPIPLPPEIVSKAGVNQESGLMVFSVEQESAARKAGLALCDVLLKLDDKPVTDLQDLQNLLGEELIGKKVKVSVLRGEKLTELTVTPSATTP
jgi:S1-C subfamily serine protease